MTAARQNLCTTYTRKLRRRRIAKLHRSSVSPEHREHGLESLLLDHAASSRRARAAR
jgi:ribosomal protein S18 acetylase RimI-like enzyme